MAGDAMPAARPCDLAGCSAEQVSGTVHRFEALLTESWDLPLVLGRDGRVLFAGPSVPRILGLSPDEIRGSDFLDRVPDGDRELVRAALRQALDETADAVTCTHRLRHSCGHLLHVESRISNRTQDPDVDGLVLNLRDVTRFRRAETRLRDILEGSVEAIVVHRGGKPLFANSAVARMVGFGSATEFVDQPSIIPFLHPEDRAMIAANIQARLAGRPAPDSYEFRLVARDGRTIWVDCRASVIDWEGGTAVLAALFDIGDRKRAEDAQRRSQHLFEKVFQASPDCITVTGLDDGRYIAVNDRFYDLCGYKRSRVLGRTSSEFRIWADPEFRPWMLEQLRAGRTVRDVETRVRHRDGTVKDVTISADTLVTGDQTALVIVARDISERKRQEEELRLAKEAAELANRSKTEFLANMSHELRTPLNAIIGFSEIIKNQLLGPVGATRYREYATDIYRSGTHLLDIINDILDLSKLEAGKLDLHEREISVPDVVEDCLRLVRERAHQAGLRLTTEIAPDLPHLWADQRLVKQILLNLLSNAIKFTARGGQVTVAARIADSGELALVVADTGIGMSAADIEIALTPFGQVDSALTRRHQGSGLGVPLVKSLIERHGGRLAIASQPGAGTAATVFFPVPRVLGRRVLPDSLASEA